MNSTRPPRLLPSPVSPLSPRVLVVVTLDAERYTPVDLADVLDHGPIIRSRILTKLGIWGDEDQARALIFETEIGSLHIGQPLTDQSLAVLCRERGDSRGSLAFIVDRGPSSTRPPVPQTPPHSANSFATTSQRERNYSQAVNEQTLSNGHRPNDLRLPLDRPTRPTDTPVEGNNGVVEPQPRRPRPLPPIPTPAPTPNSGNSTGAVPYSDLHDVNNDNHDPYDPASGLKHSRGQKNSKITNRRLRQLTIPSQQLQTISSTDSSGSPPSTSIPFNWVRGELIGGNGVDSRVYMALDPVGGQIMAVKQKEFPKADLSSLPTHRSLADQAKRSFLEAIKFESELLRVLDHKNIVKYFFFEEADTTVNIFMEYVPGGTLRGILKSFGPFPENITKFLTTQILDGLAYLHSHHILQRDLRAESILVQQDGVCKISDFAVSKFADTGGLVYTALQGSTFWMAPEVITTKIHGGGYTTKVDIWSLGCLVIEMWSNGRPWTGLDAPKVMQRLSDALSPPLPDGLKLSRKAKDFYDKCFIVDPILRPSASELRRHCYLDLPYDWIFSLPPERPTSGPPDLDANHLATPTTPLRVVDKVPPQFCLHGFPRYSSSDLQPSDWLRKNILDLLEYINQSNRDPQIREECSSWVKGCLLFPRLIIFSCEAIYDLTELRTSIHSWQSWNTPLAALIRYKEVNDRLLSFYEDIDQVEGLKSITALDMDTICVYLHSIVTIKESFRQLLDLQGNEAQSILDLLQMLLDIPNLATEFRRHFMNAMLKLSRRSKFYPSPLLQHQVLLEGAYAVASGQFGDVWKGTFRNQQVAVKNDERRIGLVSPWMDNGNLQQFLRRNFDANRVSLMVDIAEGLDYLHNIQPTIVHGDLKAVNILITDTCRACLADFGLSTASKSRVLDLSSFSSDQMGGTARWTAPELLNGSQSINTPESDVYSFGCVCYEIFSGDVPFSETSLDSAVIYKVTVQHEQPCRPKNCKPHGKPSSSLGLDDHLWVIVEKCWKSNPDERPTMRHLTAMLPPRATPVQPGAEKYFQPLHDDSKWNLIAWASNFP
ncbi:MAP kinase kinase kinase mkh1 [Termitomyces sp. J132]|nr:MAP kinase kinase kinase mkh1 [Termitomyces sp. J132]